MAGITTACAELAVHRCCNCPIAVAGIAVLDGVFGTTAVGACNSGHLAGDCVTDPQE